MACLIIQILDTSNERKNYPELHCVLKLKTIAAILK